MSNHQGSRYCCFEVEHTFLCLAVHAFLLLLTEEILFLLELTLKLILGDI